MRYLIKEFEPGEGIGFTLHLATDEADEVEPASLWGWIRKAKRDDTEMCIYRMVSDIATAKPWDDILMIDHEGRLILQLADRIRSLAELATDPNVKSYRLECVLDLS